MKYKKPPLTFPQQVDLLKDRGHTIKEENEAIEILKNINYYRLSAYFSPFNPKEMPSLMAQPSKML